MFVTFCQLDIFNRNLRLVNLQMTKPFKLSARSLSHECGRKQRSSKRVAQAAGESDFKLENKDENKDEQLPLIDGDKALSTRRQNIRLCKQRHEQEP